MKAKDYFTKYEQALVSSDAEECSAAITLKKIVDCEGENGRYYLELPDGYRLIYDNDGYVGHYDPNLNEVI